MRLVKREVMEVHELQTLGELKLVALKRRMDTGGSISEGNEPYEPSLW